MNDTASFTHWSYKWTPTLTLKIWWEHFLIDWDAVCSTAHRGFQEWQAHLNTGVSPVNDRSMLTKLPLIDVQRCVYAREAALESAVLQCCHVLIFISAFRHVVWSYLIKIKCELLWIWGFFVCYKAFWWCLCFLCLSMIVVVFFYEDLATLTLYRRA